MLQESSIESSKTNIKSLIYVVRNQQVMIDSDLAMLYQVETKVFNQAVKRNIARFPDNFRFQLNKDEFESLRSQIVTSKGDIKKGGRRYLPYVFTEQGIAKVGIRNRGIRSFLRSQFATSSSEDDNLY